MTALQDRLTRDDLERIVLVEVDYVAEDSGAPVTRTLYLSTAPYVAESAPVPIGSPTGSPIEFEPGPTQIYEDCINSVPQFQRALSGPVASVYSSSLGSLEIDNADGDKDFILGLALDGSEVRVYIVNETESPQQTLLFSALAIKASVPSFDRISIQLKDAGALLNKSVGGEVTVGGTGPNADQWRPVNFGYVHNLQARVLDAATLTYVHSDTGTFTAVVDVRDKGVSVTYTDNGDGTFTLDASPAGIVTCDVVATIDGTDPGRKISDLFEFLIDGRNAANSGFGFASAGPTFTIGDDDDYLIGISVPEARNIVDVLNQVCDSGNCFWAIKRTGEFTFGRLRPNNIADFGFSVATIREDDYDEGSWKIDHDLPGYYLLQAYMSRNWYSQTDFAGVLTPDEQAVYTRKGIYLLQDTAVGSAYADVPEQYDKTLSISPALDTLLSGGFDELDLPYLTAWMETRRFMQLPWIERLSVTVGLDYYFLELGDPVVVETPRYGLDGGELFQVISINIDLTRAKIGLVLLRRHLSEPLPPDWVRITAATEIAPPPMKLARTIFTPTPPYVDYPPPWAPGGEGLLIRPAVGSGFPMVWEDTFTGGSVFFLDQFSGTAGLLESHTANTGQTWWNIGDTTSPGVTPDIFQWDFLHLNGSGSVQTDPNDGASNQTTHYVPDYSMPDNNVVEVAFTINKGALDTSQSYVNYDFYENTFEEPAFWIYPFENRSSTIRDDPENNFMFRVITTNSLGYGPGTVEFDTTFHASTPVPIADGSHVVRLYTNRSAMTQAVVWNGIMQFNGTVSTDLFPAYSGFIFADADNFSFDTQGGSPTFPFPAGMTVDYIKVGDSISLADHTPDMGQAYTLLSGDALELSFLDGAGSLLPSTGGSYVESLFTTFFPSLTSWTFRARFLFSGVQAGGGLGEFDWNIVNGDYSGEWSGVEAYLTFNDPNWELWVYSGDDVYQVGSPLSSPYFNITNLTGLVTISNDVWHTIEVTVTGTTVSWLIDGILVDSTSTLPSVAPEKIVTGWFFSDAGGKIDYMQLF